MIQLNVLDFARRSATAYRDRIGVVDDPSSPDPWPAITYGQLFDRASSLAAALDALGIAAGERVALIGPNSARAIVAYFGVPGWGRTLVPIDYRLTSTEIDALLRRCGVRLVLIDAEFADLVPPVPGRIVLPLGSETDRQLFHQRAEPALWDSDESAVATINFTSGTTSQPKGVCLSHRAIWLGAVTYGWHIGVSENEIYLHTLQLAHANGWGLIYAVTGMAGHQIVMRVFDADRALDLVDEERVTLLCGAPIVAQRLLAASEGRLAAIHGTRMLVAGSRPSAELIDKIRSVLGWEFIQSYGLTETAPLLTLSRMRREWAELPSAEQSALLSRAGSPGIGVTLRVADDGEVAVQTNHTADRYWEDAQATSGAMRDDWFTTGDCGVVEPDGALRLTDRKKDIIITGGINVSPSEVESVISQHPAVGEVAVVGAASSEWGEAVTAMVVLAPRSRPSTVIAGDVEAEIIAFCRMSLAPYKCPKSVVVVDALPRTVTGKLSKQTIRDSLSETAVR